MESPFVLFASLDFFSFFLPLNIISCCKFLEFQMMYIQYNLNIDTRTWLSDNSGNCKFYFIYSIQFCSSLFCSGSSSFDSIDSFFFSHILRHHIYNILTLELNNWLHWVVRLFFYPLLMIICSNISQSNGFRIQLELLQLFSLFIFSKFIFFILNFPSNRGFNDFSIELFVSVSVIRCARVWYENRLIVGIELSPIASFPDYWISWSLLIRTRCLCCVRLHSNFLQGRG